MNIEEAISKAARLLRLAKSDNEHEAASAAAKAQDIIDRYRIDHAALELEGAVKNGPEEPIVDFRDAPLDGQEQGRLATWLTRLAITVARANCCRTVKHGGAMTLVGRPTDVESARYLYGWMKGEVERLVTGKVGYGPAWRNSFRHGVVDTIGVLLRAQRQSTHDDLRSRATSATAMTLVNNAIARVEQRGKSVDVWMDKNLRLRKASFSGGGSDWNARHQGQQAGKSIKLSRSRGALGAG